LHVCKCRYVFLDVVDFTNRTLEAQAGILFTFNDLITQCLEEHDVAAAQRVIIPMGDCIGIALLGDLQPADLHMRLALSILAAVHMHNEKTDDPERKFGLHLALEENDDLRLDDIEQKPNIAGRGLNNAYRIMRLAGSNQLLVSPFVHAKLLRLIRYRHSFRELQAPAAAPHQTLYQLIDSSIVGLNTELPPFAIAGEL